MKPAILISALVLATALPARAIDLGGSGAGLVSRQPVLRIVPPRRDAAEIRRPTVRAPLDDYYPTYWYNSPFQFSRTGRDERAYPRIYCAEGEACARE